MPKFNNFTKLFTLFIATAVIVSTWATSVNAQVQLTEQSKLAINGIGPIRVGMTVDEASRAAGVRLVNSISGGEEYGCLFFKPEEPKNLNFMVTNGRIARITVMNDRITTIKGAKIGDTEDRIIALYPGQIQVIRAPLRVRENENSKNLTFVPKDAVDKNYRIIFETYNNKVSRFRSGKLPEVEFIEGCL